MKTRILSLFLAMLPALAAAAEEKPLWEAGAGVSALTFPAYRGSDERSNFLLPVPYFAYHGKFFKADRHGIRGALFDSDRVDFTVSASLSPPAKSENVQARAGMPNLDATFELGPQLDLTFWRSENRARYLKLLLPVRAAVTVDSQPKDVGWVFHPRFNFDVTDIPGLSGWNFGVLAGAVYGNRRQNAYYYTVAPEYATPLRPAYEASGGYGGAQFLAAVSKRYPKFWVGGFVRYDNLSGAVFDDSPLVRQKDYFAAGIAVSYIFGESSTRVMVDD
ncbi:MAG: MipA/OmpV family protein [Betaproteobacteria bacterium]|nr:MipA/OmpV family protein [Betaproteobacteria bacterium]